MAVALCDNSFQRTGGKRGGANLALSSECPPSDTAPLSEWQTLVDSHPEAGVFHSPEWMGVLADTYGLELSIPRCLAGEKAGVIVPFLEVKTMLGKRKGVSLPFTDCCPPLLAKGADACGIWEGILAHARHRSWDSVEIRGGTHWMENQPPSLSFYGHSLDLRLGEKELFARLDSSVRRAIRKAQREELKVEASSGLDAVRTYFELHCQTRQRHGMPPQPFGLFERIHHHLLARERGFIMTARHHEVPVASAVFLRFRDKWVYKFGASNLAFQNLRANDLVFWTAIQQLIRDGGTELHFGRTSKHNAGLRRFKLGWGSQEQELHYHRFDLRKARFVQDQDKAHGWHNSVFRVMPLWLARWVGSWLYQRAG